MQKLIPAALLVMVLIAAPVLAQETTDPEKTTPAPEPTPTEPEPTPAPEPTPTEPEPTPTEPVPLPAPLPQDPPPEAAPLAVSQEVVEDKKADDGDLEQAPVNQEAILDALRQAADEQEADDVGAKQELEDSSDDIANLIQRLEDQKDDTPSLQQRNGDRKDNNNDHDDDDDDNRPGRKDKDEKEDRDGDIKLETDQEAESGDVDQSVEISNTGDYAQQCVAVLQAANTGNAQNAPAFLQYSGDADDFEPGGIEIDISPQIVQDCRQIIQQTSVVNQLLPGAGRSRAGQPGTRRPGVAGAGIPPRVAGAGFTGAGSGGAFNVPTRLGQSAAGISGIGQARVQPLNAPSPGRMLPRTGGPGAVSLLTLGAGALLIAGGLLVRRISR